MIKALERINFNVVLDNNFKIFDKIDNKYIVEKMANMATLDEKTEFLKLCASQIRENYSGNPLELEFFNDKLNLLKDLTKDNLKTTLISFVKSKLEAKAREIIPSNIVELDEIITALRSKIRPDNSKVIAGKIAALQIKNNNFSEFRKIVEELSDALERTLIIEGMTQEKAH